MNPAPKYREEALVAVDRDQRDNQQGEQSFARAMKNTDGLARINATFFRPCPCTGRGVEEFRGFGGLVS